MLGGLVRANFIIVLDLIKLVYRAQFPLITLFLIPFVYLLIRVLIILPLNYIMINKNGGRDRRLIRNAGLLVELSFPTVSSFQGLRVRSVGHDNAPRDMPGVQRLESSGRVHVGALVPQLYSHLFAVDPQDLEGEVSIGAQSWELGVLLFLVVLIFIASSIGDVVRMVVRNKLWRRHKHCRGMVCRRLCEGVGTGVIVFEYLYY